MEPADAGVGQNDAAIRVPTDDQDLLFAFALSVLVRRRGTVDDEDVLENCAVLEDCEDRDLHFYFSHLWCRDRKEFLLAPLLLQDRDGEVSHSRFRINRYQGTEGLMMSLGERERERGRFDF